MMKLKKYITTNNSAFNKKDDWDFVNYLDTGSITENKIDNIQYIDLNADKLPSRAKRKVNVGDIIYSTVRPNQLHYGIIKSMPINFLVSTGFTTISTDKSKLDSKFLYYYLTQKEIVEHLQSIAEQSVSTYPSIKASDIEDLDIEFPDLSEQKQIAKTLSSIDDKIELNNKINDNLEQQARLLVRNWEESEPCPKSTCKIHEVAEINTLTYSAKDNWEYVNYLDTSNITNGVLHEIQHIDTTTEKLPSRAKRKVLKNDIVYSTVRPNQLHFGIISTPRDNMLVSTGFAVIRCIKSNINNEFLYLQLTEKDVIESLQQIGEQSTSTFPAVKPIDIGNIEIAFTDANDTELLNVIKNIFESISNNLQQNQKLAELRGDLLPRLMSGEIDASQIEI